jgi:hypothetical protein
MKKSLLLVFFLAWFASGSLLAQTPADKPVVKLDPSLDALISPDAKLELVKGDFGFTEGIVWVDQGNSGYLLLSDMYANVIYKLTAEGKVSLYLDHSGYTGYDIWRVGMPQPDSNRKDVFFMIGSNGLALDRQGRLLIATWTGRSIDRIEKDGKRTILADRYEGKRFGGTNDLVVKKDGAIYFTDGFAGCAAGIKIPARNWILPEFSSGKTARSRWQSKILPHRTAWHFPQTKNICTRMEARTSTFAATTCSPTIRSPTARCLLI